ncbi:MAG: tRNA adenosine(34) deaminase TadA [Pseudomonadota bacterium]|nr:tRNA adenosine(34) deaminase TadA [Pseudomonadota bacterium]
MSSSDLSSSEFPSTDLASTNRAAPDSHPSFIGQRVEDDDAAMDMALALAERAAANGEVPVGAIVLLDGEVVGEGANAPISSLDPTAHAEVLAIRDAAQRLGNYRLSQATLVVTVEPCSMCAGAIVHSRIARVVYGTTEPKAGVAESAERFFEKPFLNWQVTLQAGVKAEACSSVMTSFFAARRAGKKKLKQASKPIAD